MDGRPVGVIGLDAQNDGYGSSSWDGRRARNLGVRIGVELEEDVLEVGYQVFGSRLHLVWRRCQEARRGITERIVEEVGRRQTNRAEARIRALAL